MKISRNPGDIHEPPGAYSHQIEVKGNEGLLKITYYPVGEIDTARRRKIIRSKLRGHQPCSTLLYVTGLEDPVYKVEIDAWMSRAEQGPAL